MKPEILSLQRQDLHFLQCRDIALQLTTSEWFRFLLQCAACELWASSMRILFGKSKNWKLDRSICWETRSTIRSGIWRAMSDPDPTSTFFLFSPTKWKKKKGNRCIHEHLLSKHCSYGKIWVQNRHLCRNRNALLNTQEWHQIVNVNVLLFPTRCVWTSHQCISPT